MMLPKRLSRTTIYTSPWVELYTDKVLMPSGKIIEKYHQIKVPFDSVVVVLTNDKDQICFIKSLRYTTGSVDWELPAGGIDKGESPTEAATREILEETGLDIEDPRVVSSYNPANDMMTKTIYVVYAKLKSQHSKDFDIDEVSEVYWLSETEARQIIEDDDMPDGSSLIPLLLWLNGIKRD